MKPSSFRRQKQQQQPYSNNNPDVMAIRPVTSRFPTTTTVWQATNLPLACVLTPLAPLQSEHDNNNNNSSSLMQGKNHLDKKEIQPASSRGSTVGAHQRTTTTTTPPTTTTTTLSSTTTTPLAIVAKCLHCGAPHPVASVGLSHFRHYQQQQELLCFFCGKASSTVWEDQYAARSGSRGRSRSHSSNTTSGGVEGWMQLDTHRDLYEKYPPLHNDSYYNSNNYSNNNASSQRNKPPQNLYYHQCEIFIPLSTPHMATTGTTNTTSSWQGAAVPAMTCPPLWIVLLDGTCPHRRYWQRVAHLLRRILLPEGDEQQEQQQQQSSPTTPPPPPPCVHVAFISLHAGDDHTCSIWDLSSPVPHVLQQPLWTTLDGHNNNNNNNATRITTTTTLLQRLVPVDALHIPHIATALRAMADMGPFLAQPPEGRNSGSGSSSAAGGPALAETLSAILAWLEPCQLAGGVDYVMVQDDEEEEEEPNHRRLNTSKLPTYNYAGGKVLCLLSNTAPEEIGKSDDVDGALSSLTNFRGHIGRGGWGGSCSSTTTLGKRWPVASTDNEGVRSTTTTTMTNSNHAATATNGPTKDEDPESASSAYFSSTNNNKKAATAEEVDDDQINRDDLTRTALAQHYPNCQPNLISIYADIGQQYALAGLGIDILFLLLEQPDDEEGGDVTTITQHRQDLGLPLLKVLAETSGAPGPLLFAWNDDDDTNDDDDNGDVVDDDDDDDNDQEDSRLEREVLARVPWGDGVVLGAELRVRLTPCWSVDHQSGAFLGDASSTTTTNDAGSLAARYIRAGLMGPASSADEHESTNLWLLGSCDPFSSVTIDLVMSKQQQPESLVLGDVKVHPVIQTCFAYNTIRKHASNGHYLTERRLRIASRAMPLAKHAETLYSSLDCDALAVVLFHKLALASFQDGLMETLDIGQIWLKSLLLCAYRSAEAQEARNRLGHFDNDDDDDQDGDIPTTTIGKPLFLPNERLLDREGDLSAADVLVAQGHDRLRHVPRILYGLLQCDALRPSSADSFRPTLDARCAALAQLSSMTPAVLARCIQPRVDLWSSREDQVICEQLDLQWNTIVSVVEEQEPATQDADHLLLLLDCPHKAAVYDTKSLLSKAATGNANASAAAGNPKVTEGLRKLMEEAVEKYRVAPLIEFEMPSSAADLALQLSDALVDDAPTANGLKNFEEWKAEMAAMVHEDLSNDDDDDF